jgi:uncharacterized protein (TIGR02246 family)
MMLSNDRFFAPRLVLTFCLGILGCQVPRQASGSPLTAAEREAIRTIDTAFVHAWLRDDTTSVLRLFSAEAILFPPGSGPIEGLGAIRAYWWPTDGSHTQLTSFTRDVAEIRGTHQLAFLRGTAHLAWVYEKNGQKTTQSSRATDLVLLAPDSSGQWRIIRQMWSQLPP